MFRRGALTVLRVHGVPIRLHISVLLLVPFLTFALAAQLGIVADAARLDASRLALPGWGWGIIGSLGLLVSITLHELAHTVVAIKHGGRVESIVLMALGGVSQVSQMPKRPRHELEMAVAGPAVSILLAFLFGVGYALTRDIPNLAFPLFILSYLNLVLGVFNLLPAFPMDGGRVLRAALAWKYGKQRATRIAAMVGKGMAVLFGVFGFFGGGIWMIFIAFFVWSGASQELLHAEVQAALGGLNIGELRNTVPSIDADASLEDARMLLREEGAESAVVTEGDKTLGVIRKADLIEIPLADRMRDRVRDQMLRVQSVGDDEPVGDSFDRVLRDGEVPVVDASGHAMGVIRSADVLRKLHERGFRLPGDPERGT